MTALLVIGLAILAALLVCGVIAIEYNGRMDGWGAAFAFLFFIGTICFGVGIFDRGEISGRDRGQIDALKGVQTHEIHYLYPKGDTIPSDTLYLKIK